MLIFKETFWTVSWMDVSTCSTIKGDETPIKRGFISCFVSLTKCNFQFSLEPNPIPKDFHLHDTCMNWIFIFLALPVHKYGLILDLPELEFSSFPFLFVSFSVSPPVQDWSLQSFFSLLWFSAGVSSAFPQSGLNRLFGCVGKSFPRPWWFFGILLADLPAFLPGHQESNTDSHSPSWPPCLVAWVGILSWEGWERCPTVCSRLLGKIQGFS